MRTRAFSVVEEFLHSADPQIRKNATTALAVLNDEQSVAALTQLAVSDTDINVRERARDEILELPITSQPWIVAALGQALKIPGRQLSAYGMLGFLKNRGVNTNDVRLSLLNGLKLAWAFRSLAYPKRGWRPHQHAWKYALLGALPGVILLYIYNITLDTKGSNSLVAGAILAPLFALLLTWRAAPYRPQFARTAAFLVEVMTAVCMGTVATFLYVELAVYAGTSTIRDLIQDHVLLLIVAGGMIVGALRAGTMFIRKVFPNRYVDRIARTIPGVISSIMVAACFIPVFSKLKLPKDAASSSVSSSSSISSPSQSEDETTSLFEILKGEPLLIIFAVGCGVAYAFAAIEGEGEWQNPAANVSSLSNGTVIATAALSSAVLVAILVPVFSQARSRAKGVSCLSNVKQIGIGIMMYVQDYDERYPLRRNWCDAIDPYIKNKQVFRCSERPDDRLGYVYNSHVSGITLASIEFPATTAAVFDGKALWNTSGDIGLLEARHEGKASIGFADGHARLIPDADIHNPRSVLWDPKVSTLIPSLPSSTGH